MGTLMPIEKLARQMRNLRRGLPKKRAGRKGNSHRRILWERPIYEWQVVKTYPKRKPKVEKVKVGVLQLHATKGYRTYRA